MSSSFLESLENADLAIFFPNQSTTNIRDLFVYPELQVLKSSVKKELGVINGSELLSLLEKGNRWLISGDDQSGKTTFSKVLFLDSFSHGYTPILINGEKIKSSSLEKLLPGLLSDMYPGIENDIFLSREDLVLIIDDLSKSTINESSKRRLIESINDTFDRVIIVAGESFQFAAPDFPSLDTYERAEVIPFGHYCRNQLIDRWVNLELGEEVDEAQIYKREDELKTNVNALVRRNIVPAKPVYILMIINAFNLTRARSYDLTSYGHCYEYLIYQALDKARIKKSSDIEQYFNFLSELGKSVLDSGSNSLSKEDGEEFFRYYSDKFIATDLNKMVTTLIEASILEREGDNLCFKYRYLFYFFASKNLSDTLHRGDSAKRTISKLIETLHLEKSSNIVLFLSHHSKDPWILEEIMYSIMDIFPEEKEATLEAKSLQFLKDFTDSIPDIVLERRDAREERQNQDIRRDEIDRKHDFSSSEKEDIEDIDDEEISIFARKVEKAFRSTEVCGQILRNRMGSLEKESLEFLYGESATVLLKFLHIILETSRFIQEEGLRSIESALYKSPDSTDDEISRQARKFYMELNYGLIFAILRKISFSLGSEAGRQIYVKVAKEKKTPALSLIQRDHGASV